MVAMHTVIAGDLPVDAEASEVVIGIKSTGVQVPQSRSTRTDNRGGTGFGLAITAAILEAHHSRIKLQKGGLRAASQRHSNSVVTLARSSSGT
jgi:signal transduction histidine kinase